MDTLKKWMDNKTQITHYVAAIGTALTAAYVGYTPFRDLVNQEYALIPTNIKVLIGTVGFLYAWYHNGQKSA